VNKVIFLIAAPKPKIKGTDALWNEVEIIAKHFGGEVLSIYPFKKARRFSPKVLFGRFNSKAIKQKILSAETIHVVSPRLVYFPFLHAFSQPKVITVAARVKAHVSSNKYNHIVVNNKRDALTLKGLNFKNVTLIPTIYPGYASINKEKRNKEKPLKLLYASGPWTKQQLETKGFVNLLKALKQNSQVNLTVLLRGSNEKALQALVKRYGLSKQVAIVNKKIDINETLKAHDACILLSKFSHDVKAFPHSLIESILSGAPVLLNKSIAMADFVTQNNLGVVIDDIETTNILEGIDELTSQYSIYQENCMRFNADYFSAAPIIKKYKLLYEQLAK